MNDHLTLQTYIVDAMAALNDGRLSGRDQLKTNALGIHVAWTWATAGLRGPRSNVHVYASAHTTRRGSHWDEVDDLVTATGARVHRYEFLTDVYIERWDSKRRISHPLLVAEIEASPNHSAGYCYEGDQRSDYLCDFVKLLYVFAPKRLFVACAPSRRLGNLETTLRRALRESPPTEAARGGALGVVLLPSGTKQSADIRIGAVCDGRLEFISFSEGQSALRWPHGRCRRTSACSWPSPFLAAGSGGRWQLMRQPFGGQT